jgi:hypothetical protein
VGSEVPVNASALLMSTMEIVALPDKAAKTKDVKINMKKLEGDASFTEGTKTEEETKSDSTQLNKRRED